MNYRKVTAIVNRERLEKVERALRALHVEGASITEVRGWGEYRDFYKPDTLTRHVRVEIFCAREDADRIARGIMEAAHTGISGDGIVAVLPVEQIWCVRTKGEWTHAC
ncbi:MAG: P-II family nitrogen regulator [Mariprofundaceae bacterium]